MGIAVVLTDERGGVLERIAGPLHLTDELLCCADVPRSTCLRFIDPYGRTIFNAMQLPVLIEELEVLRRLVDPAACGALHQRQIDFAGQFGADIAAEAMKRPPAGAEHLRQRADDIIALARRGLETPHRYITFIGD